MKHIASILFTLVFCFSLAAQNYLEQADEFLSKMPVGLQNRQSSAIRLAIDGIPDSLHKVRNSRNSAPEINPNVEVVEISKTLRLYQPKQKQNEKLPLLVYFHGGGWTIGSINSCARYCSELAATGRIMVLAVEYRLAPEYPFPCGLNDCVSAFRYAVENAESWGSAADMVSVGGDSSGGNLALSVALTQIENKDILPCSLVLYYPVVSSWNDVSESWKMYAEGYALDGKLMYDFNRAYCEGVKNSIAEDAHVNYFISPSVASDSLLSHLPQILFVAAERDILYSQGAEFCRRLNGLGVSVIREELKGSVHLFVTVKGQEKAFRFAVSRAASFLSEKI